MPPPVVPTATNASAVSDPPVQPVPSPRPSSPAPVRPPRAGPRVVVSGVAALALIGVGAVFFFAHVDLPARSLAAIAPVPTDEAPAAATPETAPSATPEPTPDRRQEAVALTEKGMAALNAGDAKGADVFFGQALEADPGCARAHLGIGTAAMLRGDNDVARQSFVKFIELAPDDPLAQQTRTLMETL